MSLASNNLSGSTPLMAAGQPIGKHVADEAAAWLTLFMSKEASEVDMRRWRQWRSAHPDHERAWQHIEAVTNRMKVLEPTIGYQVLSPYSGAKSASKRKLLSLLLWGGVASTTGVLASRTQTWQRQMADYQTGTGDQRAVMLADGTQITLNSGSAINVRFDDTYRVIRLVAGEVSVVTAHALGQPEDARPLMVETAEGSVRALGTRFNIRQNESETAVAVQESAVEITPIAGAFPRTVKAGEFVSFTRTTIAVPRELTPADDAWVRGQIIATDMPLSDFASELSRYRTGFVRCAPEVAQLRVSGVFPLHDTTSILGSLPNVLPVKISLRTRFWVTIDPIS